MPPNYEEIRTALDRGFSVENLRRINRACLDVLQKGGVSHACVWFTIAVIADWIAESWDEKPINTATAARVEHRMKPHLEALLSLEDADTGVVSKTLDEAVVAFTTTLLSTLDM